MKKILMIMAAVAFSFASIAQNSTSGKMETKKETKKASPRCFEMKNGKIMQMKEGSTTEILGETTLENGAVLTKDGVIKMPDGSTRQVKEGECVNMDGKIENKTDGKKSKDKQSKMNKSDDSKMDGSDKK
jgi:hypothetical protein